jgi:Spy/CpxP family protein refolding chaperone
MSGPPYFSGDPTIYVPWGQLNLSDEQKRLFVSKRREFQIETAGLRQELSFLQEDLRAEMGKSPVDGEALENILANMASTRQRLSEAAVKNLLSLKALLTPAQCEQLGEFQAQLPPDLQSLKLTTEQRRTMSKMMNSALRKDRQASGQLQALRAELRELLFMADDPDLARLIEVQHTIVEQEMVLEKTRIDLFLQMRAVLTPEQFERYQQYRERKTRGEVPPPMNQRKRH